MALPYSGTNTEIQFSGDWCNAFREGDTITISGWFTNVESITGEETMTAKINEMLLDLMQAGNIGTGNLAEIRRIIAIPEWDSRVLLYLLALEVKRGLTAADLGIESEDDE